MKKAIGFLGAGLLATAMATQGANADGMYSTDVDVTGWNDGDSITLDLGGMAEVTGISWQVTLHAEDDGSWLSDGQFQFGPAGEPVEINLNPGAGNNGPGTEKFTGSAKFDDAGLPNIELADGMLQIAYTNFGWSTWVVDDEPFSSYLTIQYNLIPAPGALALLGLAGLVGVRRRRA